MKEAGERKWDDEWIGKASYESLEFKTMLKLSTLV